MEFSLIEEIPSKESRFTDSQIIAVLKQAEAATPVPESNWRWMRSAGLQWRRKLLGNCWSGFAKIRFSVTKGTLSKLRSRSALAEKFTTLIDREMTHDSIARAAAADQTKA